VEPAAATAPVARAVRMPGFDGLRGLAALSVLVYHVGQFVPDHDRVTASIVGRLDQGVSVFFVLSGFLLARPFIAANLRGEPAPRLAPYARRRFLRIYPAYWCALLVSVYILDQGTLRGFGLKAEHLALVQTYFHWPHGTALTVAWTLVIEVTFYAVLPLYAALTRLVGRRVRPLYAELGGALTVLVAGTAVQVAYSASSTSIPVWARILPLYAPMFAWGMLLAIAALWWHDRETMPRPLHWIARHGGLCWLAGIGCLLGLAAFLGTTPPIALHRSHVLALFVVGGLLGLAFVLPLALSPTTTGVVPTVLGWRPVAFLGTISYAFYLWHLALMDKIDPHFTYRGLSGFLELMLLTIAATVAVATASWYLLERPVIKWSRRPWVVPRRRRESV
jgi:peptidoglycan/LPS O-acetylase OafA/YrhL